MALALGKPAVDYSRAPSYCTRKCMMISSLVAVAVGNVSLLRSSLVEFLKFLIKRE